MVKNREVIHNKKSKKDFLWITIENIVIDVNKKETRINEGGRLILVSFLI